MCKFQGLLRFLFNMPMILYLHCLSKILNFFIKLHLNIKNRMCYFIYLILLYIN